MRAVPRDLFVPPELAERGLGQRPAADRRRPDDLPAAGRRAHVELLELRGDERILDVGTGSGYHAALLGAARRARVDASSATATLSEQARRNLRRAPGSAT